MTPRTTRCRIIATSSHVARADCARARIARKRADTSFAACEWRSSSRPRLPSSFSTVETPERGTHPAMGPPPQMSQPTARSPAGCMIAPASWRARAASQSDAYAENLFQLNPTAVAMLPAPSSRMIWRRSPVPLP